MPQIETWSRLPAAVRAHLVERMHDRKISLEDLNQLRLWMEAKPLVPGGHGTRTSVRSSCAEKAAIRKHSCWRGRRPRGRSSNRAQPLNYQSCRAFDRPRHGLSHGPSRPGLSASLTLTACRRTYSSTQRKVECHLRLLLAVLFVGMCLSAMAYPLIAVFASK
jgi:hypothetical protein